MDSAEEFESWVFDEILPTVERTGGYFEEGREEEVIDRYFSSFSDDVKLLMLKDLQKAMKEEKEKNRELQQFYDDLMDTEGLMPINRVAKELEIGEYKLFKFLRDKKIFFYDKDMINLPYERFRKEGKFKVKETPCQDGEIRSVTYATKKGLEYIRKLLRKDGYYNMVTK